MHESELKSLARFAGLGRKEREHLARRADAIDVREGKKLAVQGRNAYEFFVIREGTAEVLCDDRHLADLGPGDFFGEMGIVSHAPRNASVVATSDMRLLVITDTGFRAMQREAPAVAARIEAACKARTDPALTP